MGKDIIDVHLNREHSSEPWGFRLSGGKDQGQPLSISQVTEGSITHKAGLLANDFLISIANLEVFDMTHDEAERTIQQAGDRFTMVIERMVEEKSRKISFEKSATTFALRLGAGTPEVVREAEAFISNVPFSAETPALGDGVNFKKFEKKPMDISASKTLEDVAKKANLQKDWNCPWVTKDGSRLKQAVRYIDEPLAPAKTSQQHYYSSPGSILAPEPQISKEQLEALIREHGQESRPQSRTQNTSRPKLEEEGVTVRKESFQQEETYYREREDDSQAPPDLEPVNLGYEQFQQQSGTMPGYGEEPGYEPSADELIEVLKNLENLAAADPRLYRTIVDQIKGGAMGGFFQQVTSSGNGQASQFEQQMYEQQMFEQQQREAEIYQQQQQQQLEMQMQQQQLYEEQQQLMQQQQESSMQMQMQSSSQKSSSMQQQQTSSMQQHSSSMQQQSSSVQQQSSSIQQQTSSMQQQSSSVQQSSSMQKRQQKTETAQSLGMSEAEFTQHQRMQRLEAEAQEEVRQTLAKQREAKMKKLHPPAPPPPKEITVIAGDGKAVKVKLGGDSEEADSRRQVAEAAGLKHVALPEFENTDESAWAGSLKKTSKFKAQTQEAEEENPWAGSLRHVDDNRKGKQRKDEKEDTYGNAPWMGTLRHVVHDNKVTKNYGVNQFQSKRYPDEDAGNPFESSQGSNSRPQFPLTPAAIINGSVMSRDEMARREEEEEVERIRSNIGSKTVSTALLQALMPKLLKMHEAKYEPMDKVDAQKIMEEILGMQAGLNPDQQADANEEAEMIIRAIMQEEIDKSIYSKMADDLETAKKRMNKKKSKKIASVSGGSGITA